MKWFSLAAGALFLALNACERHPAATLQAVEAAKHHHAGEVGHGAAHGDSHAPAHADPH